MKQKCGWSIPDRSWKAPKTWQLKQPKEAINTRSAAGIIQNYIFRCKHCPWLPQTIVWNSWYFSGIMGRLKNAFLQPGPIWHRVLSTLPLRHNNVWTCCIDKWVFPQPNRKGCVFYAFPWMSFDENNDQEEKGPPRLLEALSYSSLGTGLAPAHSMHVLHFIATSINISRPINNRQKDQNRRGQKHLIRSLWNIAII